jgi:putative membrane protein
MHRRFLATLAGTVMLGLVCAASAQSATKTTDSDFMIQAVADGMAEVNMGRLALKKSSDPQVKRLAQRIVSDHTEANGKLRALALRKHVRLPAEPTAEAIQKAAAMKKMEGKNFDRAWADAMVKDHLKAIDLFATASQQAEDTAVRKFAEDTAPALQTHLQMAQKLTGMPTTDAAGTTP